MDTSTKPKSEHFQYTSEITVNYIDHMGDDARIAMAAWVSPSIKAGLEKEGLKPGSVSGVNGYMMKHRHGTPFEHSCIQMYVHAPIFVWREWHRHRIAFSYNEESARYKTLEPVFYIPPRNRPMMKVDNWKPGRPKFLTIDDYIFEQANGQSSGIGTKIKGDAFYADMIADMMKGYHEEYDRYLRQLDRMIDPGLARDNLPVGIYSSCWVTTNPRALMHFLSLRTHDEAAKFISYPLYEMEVAARKVEELLARYWPITYANFVKEGRVAP